MRHHFAVRQGKSQRGRSLPRQTQPHGHKTPRMSTDKKVLWGVCGVFLMGVAYSAWISMQVIGCCG